MDVKELEFDRKLVLKRGNTGKEVKRLQEWLCLHGCTTGIDGDFGPATEAALAAFRSKAKLPGGAVADAAVFEALLAPMTDAFTTPKPKAKLGNTYVAVALQHLAVHPVEVGGDNRGPWVRAYCQGMDGPNFAWCAGFTCTLLAQACEAMKMPVPLVFTLWVPNLAVEAQQKKIFVSGRSAKAADRVTPGSLFFVPGPQAGFWTHIGIVTEMNGDSFRTIEGNTNTTGSANGFEVCARFRATRTNDFAVLG